jgi:hypothetical protein
MDDSDSHKYSLLPKRSVESDAERIETTFGRLKRHKNLERVLSCIFLIATSLNPELLELTLARRPPAHGARSYLLDPFNHFLY